MTEPFIGTHTHEAEVLTPDGERVKAPSVEHYHSKKLTGLNIHSLILHEGKAGSVLRHQHHDPTAVTYHPLHKGEAPMSKYEELRDYLAKAYGVELEKAKSISTPAVGIQQYRYSHGKYPRGTGRWMFGIGGNTHAFDGSYTQAKRQAKKVARAGGHGMIHVLP